MNAALLAGAQVVLADDDKGRGSPIGLFVVLVLCIAVYFLYKSLNKHIKRVPESFDAPAEVAPAAGAERGAGAERVEPEDGTQS